MFKKNLKVGTKSQVFGLHRSFIVKFIFTHEVHKCHKYCRIYTTHNMGGMQEMQENDNNQRMINDLKEQC